MQRNQTIEIIRIAAAFGIVLFHAHAPGAEIGYSGLVAFVILNAMFEAESETTRTVKEIAKRLIVPWAFWSVVYLALRWAVTGYPFHEGMNPAQSILYGDHLWFLPFAFVAIVLIRAAKKFEKQLAPYAAILAIGFMLDTESLRDLTQSLPVPLAQWVHALPAVFIGVAAPSLLPASFAMAGVLFCLSKGVPGISIPYALGSAAVLSAKHFPPIKFNVEPISRCMFGVYLVHILALSVANRLVGSGTLLTAGVAFAGSLAFVLIARKVARPLLG